MEHFREVAEQGNSKHRKMKICCKLQQSQYQMMFYILIYIFIYLFIRISFSTETAAVSDRSESFSSCFRFTLFSMFVAL